MPSPCAAAWTSRAASSRTGKRRHLVPRERRTPLQTLLRTVAGTLTWAAMAAAVVGALLGLSQRDATWQSIVLTGLSLAFALIPEELPLLAAAVLAVGERAHGPLAPRREELVEDRLHRGSQLGRGHRERAHDDAHREVHHVVVHVALKPTSSIRLPRRSINKKGEPVVVETTGRHDPCVGIRATPIAEAMLAIVLMDHALRHRAQCGDVQPALKSIPASL